MFDVVKIKDIKVLIGQLVKIYRKQEGFTQQELADLLAMSRITIQNLESGKNFTIDTLLKVAKHFQLLDELKKHLSNKIDEQNDLESLY